MTKDKARETLYQTLRVHGLSHLMRLADAYAAATPATDAGATLQRLEALAREAGDNGWSQKGWGEYEVTIQNIDGQLRYLIEDETALKPVPRAGALALLEKGAK